MNENRIQLQLFQQIKNVLPSHVSLVDIIAETLGISNDSAYRRLRGEKPLSLEEVKKLCSRYSISMDQLLNHQSDSFLFTGKFVETEGFNFENYLQRILSHLKGINSFQQREVFYFSKDLPVFYFLMFPELAALKYYTWMKTLLQYKELANIKFNINLMQDTLSGLGVQIAEEHNKIPGTDIMSTDNILITLRQLEYCKAMKQIESEEDLRVIYDRIFQMIDHMESQTAVGQKYMPGKIPNTSSASYKVFINDLVVGDNSNVAVFEKQKIVFLNHNVINLLVSTDQRFCDYSFDFIQNVIKKSTMISVVGERERSIYFNNVRDTVELSKNNKSLLWTFR